uniref:Uncharacterized protein n=1 Tax=Aplanochytrium stocchinoi TaxID=215587 RepID=A0A7S3PE69_9STRA|mmetsp:Transcript_1467/g.1883  ORF Transcript_1467/g.1883 Transcript_1467/m.1883 type:complete len:192 (-) Transcript_1467:342-917(-)|eukprot:CAMPEP_0204832232 /NCGR_PEP_ID=MMETSP1346-20131115/12888_1 /ASSEMBLY_ACC=CAM_ASM_000771 /TAXON_ID=215587 /ORGANISM="Aplanochytrium stocchinoi, Strain GSBS06" /LENGTH=191 /DNA_ID=CAMNT_0051963879 /DNA_START=414 /DNA_END=989 /DNA_ORIENTATION=-
MAPALKKSSIKCVLVGDGAVGKTCLFAVYAKGEFPKGYIPTVMDNYSVTVFVKQKEPVILEVWDTAGQEDFAAIRELSYPGTDVFVVCYSVSSMSSFRNVWDFWIKEIQNMNAPFVVCGTKEDLFQEGNPQHVSEEQATDYAKKFKAWASVRCSAIQALRVNVLFNYVLKCGLGQPSPLFKKKGGSGCVLF